MVSEPDLHQEGVHDGGAEGVFRAQVRLGVCPHRRVVQCRVSEAKWGEEHIQTERREEVVQSRLSQQNKRSIPRE